MKTLLLSVLLVHAGTQVHLSQANIFTETISSTASLLFTAKVLIPVTLGTALYLSLSEYQQLSRSHDQLMEQNQIYRQALDFHEIKFEHLYSNSPYKLITQQPVGGKFRTLFEKSEQENRELKTQVAALEIKNSILSGVVDAVQTNNSNALIKLLIQQKK